MEFEIARFMDQKLTKSFKCGICLKVFKDPLMIPNCEHIYCRECITDRLQTHSSCPDDENTISENNLVQPPKLIRELHEKLEIKCEFAKVRTKSSFF